MATVNDLLEMDAAPGAGQTLGVAGTGADVTLLGTETTATVQDDTYDSSGVLAYQAGLYQGSSGTQPAEIEGIAHDVTAISEVTYDIGAVTYTGHVITVLPIGGGAERYFFLPEDGTDPTLEIVTIQTATTIFFVDADDVAQDDTVTFVTCFLAGSRIATPSGPRRIETLRVGEPVCTLDGGALPIVWIGETVVPADHARARKRLRPVVIPPGSLGPGVPERAVSLSRQHRILVRSRIAERQFKSPEVLVAALHLERVALASVADAAGDLRYLHLLLPRHAILLVEGMGAESLWLGPQAERSLGRAALAEAVASLARANLPASGRPARPLVGGRQARNLLGRHVRNRQPLFAPEAQPAT